MRNSFPGWYQPKEGELEALWELGTIVLDASALLAPYRLRAAAQHQLFDVLEAFAEQLWVPYQAGLEYQRNRLTVITAQVQEYENIRKKLRAAEQDLLKRRRDHPVIDADRFAAQVQRSIAGIDRFIDDVQRGHPSVFGDSPDDDSVRTRWDALLDGRVGVPLKIDEAWKRDADKRYENGIPPGFEDRKKDKVARRYGDLIIWFEMIARVEEIASARGGEVPLIFVTSDAKEDWWRIADGERLGPRPELVEELATVGGRPFWMYSVARFIQHAGARLGWEVDPQAQSDLNVTDTVPATAALPAGDDESGVPS